MKEKFLSAVHTTKTFPHVPIKASPNSNFTVSKMERHAMLCNGDVRECYGAQAMSIVEALNTRTNRALIDYCLLEIEGLEVSIFAHTAELSVLKDMSNITAMGARRRDELQEIINDTYQALGDKQKTLRWARHCSSMAGKWRREVEL